MDREKNFLPRLNDNGGDISHRWYVVYYKDDKRVRIYGGLNALPTAAQRYELAQTIIDNLGIKDSVLLPSTSLVARDLRYALGRKTHLLRKKTIQTYESKIRGLEQWILDNGIGKFSEEHAELFLAQLISVKGLSQGSYNAYKVTLQVLWNKAYPGKDNPFKGIAKARAEKKGARYFSSAQIIVLKGQMMENDPQLWLACQFIYYCFIRPGELRKLRIGDIQFSEGTVKIPAKVSKNRKEQTVRIPDAFLPDLYKAGLVAYHTDYFIIGRKGIPSKNSVGINYLGNRHRTILKLLRFSSAHKLFIFFIPMHSITSAFYTLSYDHHLHGVI